MSLRSSRNQGPIIAPSLLKCDFGNLRAELAALQSAGACLVHWDVMDGHFVPNLSYGAPIIASVRKATDLIFDAHLMMEEPGRYLDDFLNAGCDCLTFHYEAVDDPRSLLKAIRQAGRVAGLAINPGTPVEDILPLLPDCDMVLVMSVEPGFGGQSFMRIALEKLQAIAGAQLPRLRYWPWMGGLVPGRSANPPRPGRAVRRRECDFRSRRLSRRDPRIDRTRLEEGRDRSDRIAKFRGKGFPVVLSHHAC